MKQLTYKQIAKIAKDAITSQSWLTEDALKEEMNDVLCSVKHDLILAALGVDRSFGEWRIRGDGSLNAIAQVVSKNRLQQLGKDVWDTALSEPDFHLTAKETASLRKSFKEVYYDVLYEAIRKLAKERALLDASSIFNDFINRPDPSETEE
jgi:hypothetical protein